MNPHMKLCAQVKGQGCSFWFAKHTAGGRSNKSNPPSATCSCPMGDVILPSGLELCQVRKIVFGGLFIAFLTYDGSVCCAPLEKCINSAHIAGEKALWLLVGADVISLKDNTSFPCGPLVDVVATHSEVIAIDDLGRLLRAQWPKNTQFSRDKRTETNTTVESIQKKNEFYFRHHFISNSNTQSSSPSEGKVDSNLEWDPVVLLAASQLRCTVLTKGENEITFSDLVLLDSWKDYCKESSKKGCGDTFHTSLPLFLEDGVPHPLPQPLRVGQPDNADNIISLSVSDFYSVSVTQSGKVYYWGLLPRQIRDSSRYLAPLKHTNNAEVKVKVGDIVINRTQKLFSSKSVAFICDIKKHDTRFCNLQYNGGYTVQPMVHLQLPRHQATEAKSSQNKQKPDLGTIPTPVHNRPSLETTNMSSSTPLPTFMRRTSPAWSLPVGRSSHRHEPFNTPSQEGSDVEHRVGVSVPDHWSELRQGGRVGRHHWPVGSVPDHPHSRDSSLTLTRTHSGSLPGLPGTSYRGPAGRSRFFDTRNLQRTTENAVNVIHAFERVHGVKQNVSQKLGSTSKKTDSDTDVFPEEVVTSLNDYTRDANCVYLAETMPVQYIVASIDGDMALIFPTQRPPTTTKNNTDTGSSRQLNPIAERVPLANLCRAAHNPQGRDVNHWASKDMKDYKVVPTALNLRKYRLVEANAFITGVSASREALDLIGFKSPEPRTTPDQPPFLQVYRIVEKRISLVEDLGYASAAFPSPKHQTANVTAGGLAKVHLHSTSRWTSVTDTNGAHYRLVYENEHVWPEVEEAQASPSYMVLPAQAFAEYQYGRLIVMARLTLSHTKLMELVLADDVPNIEAMLASLETAPCEHLERVVSLRLHYNHTLFHKVRSAKVARLLLEAPCMTSHLPTLLFCKDAFGSVPCRHLLAIGMLCPAIVVLEATVKVTQTMGLELEDSLLAAAAYLAVRCRTDSDTNMGWNKHSKLHLDLLWNSSRFAYRHSSPMEDLPSDYKDMPLREFVKPFLKGEGHKPFSTPPHKKNLRHFCGLFKNEDSVSESSSSCPPGDPQPPTTNLTYCYSTGPPSTSAGKVSDTLDDTQEGNCVILSEGIVTSPCDNSNRSKSDAHQLSEGTGFGVSNYQGLNDSAHHKPWPSDESWHNARSETNSSRGSEDSNTENELRVSDGEMFVLDGLNNSEQEGAEERKSSEDEDMREGTDSTDSMPHWANREESPHPTNREGDDDAVHSDVYEPTETGETSLGKAIMLKSLIRLKDCPDITEVTLGSHPTLLAGIKTASRPNDIMTCLFRYDVLKKIYADILHTPFTFEAHSTLQDYLYVMDIPRLLDSTMLPLALLMGQSALAYVVVSLSFPKLSFLLGSLFASKAPHLTRQFLTEQPVLSYLVGTNRSHVDFPSAEYLPAVYMITQSSSTDFLDALLQSPASGGLGSSDMSIMMAGPYSSRDDSPPLIGYLLATLDVNDNAVTINLLTERLLAMPDLIELPGFHNKTPLLAGLEAGNISLVTGILHRLMDCPGQASYIKDVLLTPTMEGSTLLHALIGTYVPAYFLPPIPANFPAKKGLLFTPENAPQYNWSDRSANRIGDPETNIPSTNEVPPTDNQQGHDTDDIPYIPPFPVVPNENENTFGTSDIANENDQPDLPSHDSGEGEEGEEIDNSNSDNDNRSDNSENTNRDGDSTLLDYDNEDTDDDSNDNDDEENDDDEEDEAVMRDDYYDTDDTSVYDESMDSDRENPSNARHTGQHWGTGRFDPVSINLHAGDGPSLFVLANEWPFADPREGIIRARTGEPVVVKRQSPCICNDSLVNLYQNTSELISTTLGTADSSLIPYLMQCLSDRPSTLPAFEDWKLETASQCGDKMSTDTLIDKRLIIVPVIRSYPDLIVFRDRCGQSLFLRTLATGHISMGFHLLCMAKNLALPAPPPTTGLPMRKSLVDWLCCTPDMLGNTPLHLLSSKLCWWRSMSRAEGAIMTGLLATIYPDMVTHINANQESCLFRFVTMCYSQATFQRVKAQQEGTDEKPTNMAKPGGPPLNPLNPGASEGPESPSNRKGEIDQAAETAYDWAVNLLITWPSLQATLLAGRTPYKGPQDTKMDKKGANRDYQDPKDLREEEGDRPPVMIAADDIYALQDSAINLDIFVNALLCWDDADLNLLDKILTLLDEAMVSKNTANEFSPGIYPVMEAVKQFVQAVVRIFVTRCVGVRAMPTTQEKGESGEQRLLWARCRLVFTHFPLLAVQELGEVGRAIIYPVMVGAAQPVGFTNERQSFYNTERIFWQTTDFLAGRVKAAQSGLSRMVQAGTINQLSEKMLRWATHGGCSPDITVKRLSSVWSRIVKEMVDVVTGFTLGPGPASCGWHHQLSVLHHPAGPPLETEPCRTTLERLCRQHLEGTWQWLATVMNPTEAQLRTAYFTERANLGRTNDRGSNFQEYLLSLARIQHEVGAYARPAVNIGGFEHLAHVIDGILYMLRRFSTNSRLLPYGPLANVEADHTELPVRDNSADPTNIKIAQQSRVNRHIFPPADCSFHYEKRGLTCELGPHVGDILGDNLLTLDHLLPLSPLTQWEGRIPQGLSLQSVGLDTLTIATMCRSWQLSLFLMAKRFLSSLGMERDNFGAQVAHYEDKAQCIRYFMGRLQESERTWYIRTRRTAILDDGLARLGLRRMGRGAYMDIKFRNEPGTGEGVARAWFTEVSEQLTKLQHTDCWTMYANEYNVPLLFDPGNNGFFSPRPFSVWESLPFSPSPTRLTKYQQVFRAKLEAQFYTIGQYLGLAVVNSQIISLSLNKPVVKYLLDRPIHWSDLAYYDIEKYDSLCKLLAMPPEVLASCDLSFVALRSLQEGGGSVPLCPEGEDVPVTTANVLDYVELYARFLMIDNIEPSLKAMRQGFQRVLDPNKLRLLSPEDFHLLLNGAGANIDTKFLRRNTVVEVSPCIDQAMVESWLWDIVDNMSNDDKSRFLYFSTGLARMPAEESGFSMEIYFVVCSNGECEMGQCTHLPSAAVCGQTVTIPLYSDKETMATKLLYAISHCTTFQNY